MPSDLVKARKVTRYFVYGRGYNSELAAHMQIAKRYVSNLAFAHVKQLRRDTPEPYALWSEQTRGWYRDRYPADPGCNCSYCSSFRYAKSSDGHGCWIKRMADYRQIARQIIDGTRAGNGEPILALPAPTHNMAVTG